MRTVGVLLLVLHGCSSASVEGSKGGENVGGKGNTGGSAEASAGGSGPAGSGGAPRGAGGRSSGGVTSSGGSETAAGGGDPYEDVENCHLFTGCDEPAAALTFILQGTYADIPTSQARVCRNELCVTLRLDSLPVEAPPPGERVPLPYLRVSDEEHVEASVLVEAESLSLHVGWMKRTPVGLEDGDRYTVLVTNPDGRELTLSQIGDYRVWYPFGPCEHTCKEWRPPSFDSGTCCPIEAQPGSEMFLGGMPHDGVCGQTYDFPCTGNFRVEQSAEGCPVWRYDDIECPADMDGGRD